MELRGFLRKTLLTVALGSAIALTATGCMGPAMGPAIPDTGWETDYYDALSPHTQLALGVMTALKEAPDLVPLGSRAEIARRWQKLADLIGAKAPPAEISSARREVENALGHELVAKIKAERPTTGDLMGFMMSSGTRIPKGGMKSLNPDHVAALKVVEVLNKTVLK